MRNIKKWRDVRGEFTVGVSVEMNGVVDDDGRLLPDIAFKELKDVELPDESLPELVIEFLSNGWHDPGKNYGPPEDCYPPESGDERELLAARVTSQVLDDDAGKIVRTNRRKTRHVFSDAARDALFDFYVEQVYGVELEIDATWS